MLASLGGLARRWLLTTLLVVIGVAVLVRLGNWQMDRLETRRAFNARVQAQMEQPPLQLSPEALDARLLNELEGMEYREIVVRGEYDFTHEVALRNQVWRDLYGVHLLSPLRIAGSGWTILVDRGWIPAQDFQSGDWLKYAEQGMVEVRGVVRSSQSQPDFGRISDPTPFPGGVRILAWNLANLEQISRQVPYPLLPVYLQQSPDPSWTGLPNRSQPKVLTEPLTEGPHQGYAIQWYTFAAILALGYPVFVYREEQKAHRPSRKPGKRNTAVREHFRSVR